MRKIKLTRANKIINLWLILLANFKLLHISIASIHNFRP